MYQRKVTHKTRGNRIQDLQRREYLCSTAVQRLVSWRVKSHFGLEMNCFAYFFSICGVLQGQYLQEFVL